MQGAVRDALIKEYLTDALEPFGSDPVFMTSSELYNPAAAAREGEFYNDTAFSSDLNYRNFPNCFFPRNISHLPPGFFVVVDSSLDSYRVSQVGRTRPHLQRSLHAGILQEGGPVSASAVPSWRTSMLWQRNHGEMRCLLAVLQAWQGMTDGAWIDRKTQHMTVRLMTVHNKGGLGMTDINFHWTTDGRIRSTTQVGPSPRAFPACPCVSITWGER